jgi:hypothetical protein
MAINPFEPEYDEGGWESDYESDEPEFIFRRRRPSPAAPSRSYVPPRPAAGNTVSRQEFSQALAGVRSDMQKNAAAIRAVGDQVSALATRTRQEIAGLRTNVGGSSQMMALLPLLAAPRPIEVTGEGAKIGSTDIPAGTRIARAADPMMSILPLLMTPAQGQTGQAAGTSSMDQNMLLMMALMLSRSNS